MLWIALYVPELPLQLAQRGTSSTVATVVSDGPANRPVVLCADAAARDCGVNAGMTVASARALARDLVVHARDEPAESQAMQNLAAWAYQFSPSVVVEPDGVIVEIGASLNLHGGLAQVLGRVRQGAADLGYRLSLGVAPTPMAAWLFGKARHRGITARTCTDPTTLPERLQDLPLDLLDWPADTLRKLRDLGIIRIGPCTALPREGFIQRFGASVATDLDRAHGRSPDPRPYFQPPETFRSRIEFGFEIADATALQFPLGRLLRELEGYLRARSAGVQQWELVIDGASRVTSRISFGTIAPERSADRLLHLARERLNRTTLGTPALAIAVTATQFFALPDRNLEWLPNPQAPATQFDHLVDQLSARLGADRVHTLQSIDHHQPERSWRPAQAATKALYKPVPLPPGLRPLWLLNRPRALLTEEGHPRYQGRLQLIAGPERIEGGEWDDNPASRDYYVARSPSGETVWVYREHRKPDWYLHGHFA